jgi:hypothetical protein
MIIATVTTDSGAILPLGRQGEHGVRQVRFDLSYLIETFGEGTAILVHQRSQDLAPYIVSAVQDGDRLEWTVTDADTAYKGFGKAEIRWTVGDDLAKTVTYKTSVQRSLTEQTEIPEPLESWYEQMLEQIGNSQEYAQQAAQSAETAQQAASDAAEETADAIRTEMSGYADSARQSAESAAQSAQALSGMTITVGATDKGSGVVEINATVNRG